MLRVGIVTLFPAMFEALRCGGVTARALERGLLELCTWNPREHAGDRHRTVDDRPYGGGPGMVMLVEPLRAAIGAARAALGPGTRAGYLSPQGQRLTQCALAELAARPALLLVCGRYEGIDERVVEADIDEEWSVGDYVLSGGELAAMVVVDGVARLLPGALGHEDSAGADSFSAGLLDCPHYSRPEVVAGRRVPPVLLTGHHEQIRRWRLKQALGRTWARRPDLLRDRVLDDEQRALLAEYWTENGVSPEDVEG